MYKYMIHIYKEAYLHVSLYLYLYLSNLGGKDSNFNRKYFWSVALWLIFILFSGPFDLSPPTTHKEHKSLLK